MIKIPLYPFQIEGRNKILEYKRFTIGDEMGLGKTRTIIAAQAEARPKNILTLCTKNAMATWKNQTADWLPEIESVYVKGTAKERREIWKKAKIRNNIHPRMFITTPAAFRNDFAFAPKDWDWVTIDEYDRFMLNRSKTAKTLKQLETKYFVLVSGSPVHKGPQDLWQMLNVLAPKRFTSFWKFVYTYCHVDDFGFGKQISGVRNEKQLRELLKQYFLRHKKEIVAPQIPPKLRGKLYAEMEPKQAKLYKDLKQDMIGILNAERQEYIVTENILEQITRLRQLLCCPKILDPSLGFGGGIETIIDHMHSNHEHAVIFVFYIAAIPLYMERLQQEFPASTIVTLQGGLDPNELDYRIQSFKREKGICICSINFAQSFELETAHHAYMISFSWDPETNKQAEDRLHRLITTHVVNIHYIIHENTFDNRVLKTLNEKQKNIRAIYKTPEDLKKLICDQ